MTTQSKAHNFTGWTILKYKSILILHASKWWHNSLDVQAKDAVKET
jgi:hypothetical protein